MRTALETWIKGKLGLPVEKRLTRERIASWQLKKIRETLTCVKANSPFYRQLLEASAVDDLTTFKDFEKLPFTTDKDIRASGRRMLCVSQSRIERVVTMNSSGTTGDSKRLYFTPEDLELTTDFFHHGMATVVRPGWRVLILMPGELPGSIGNLLVRGLNRINVSGIVHGPVTDTAETINAICRYNIDALVGIPSQVLGIARHPGSSLIPENQIKAVLLSTDYMSRAIVNVLENRWQCVVFDHYGMTEMGLGGALACHADDAYHLREADLFFEIIDPDTGQVVPDGHYGEIVFTTLTRTGMPLVRYRTGDCSRFLASPCPCGSVLKRMEKVRPRMRYWLKTASGTTVSMAELDEALFPVEGIVNFNVSIVSGDSREQLVLEIFAPFGHHETIAEQAAIKLRVIPGIQKAIEDNFLEISPVCFVDKPALTTGVRKRLIVCKN